MFTPYWAIAGSIGGTGTKIFSGFEVTVDLRKVRGNETEELAVAVSIEVSGIQILCQVQNGNNTIWNPAQSGPQSIGAILEPTQFIVTDPGKSTATEFIDLSFAEVNENCKGSHVAIPDSAGVTDWTTTLTAFNINTEVVADVYMEICSVDVDGDGLFTKEVNGIDYNLGNPDQINFPDGSTVHEQPHTCTVVCHDDQTSDEKKAGVPDCTT
jgi:hypothetical protein